MKDILEKVAVSNGVTRDEVESEIQKAIKAVSYTHLDVYKRQVW